MKIDIEQLVPTNRKIEIVCNDKIKLSYKRKGSGPNPKPFILPKTICVDQEFIEAISMYIGDGKLSNDKHHLDFTSKDKDMVKFMFGFFTNKLNLGIDDIRYTLTYKTLSENSVEKWANYLGINTSKIHLKQSDRHREECLGMQIGGLLFREIFGKIINEILESNFFENGALRQAFLRGLFAAEGGIGIVEKENYIAYIAYHLSHEKEEKLADLVQRLLNLEGITSKQIIRENKGERYIQITNWKNYYKCWKIGLFDLCQRKKQKFLEKVKKTNFFCKLKEEFIEKLLGHNNISHRQIGLKLGIKPATLCNLYKGKALYINKKHLLKLAHFNKISIKEVKENIIGLRVNRATIIDDISLIDFII